MNLNSTKLILPDEQIQKDLAIIKKGKRKKCKLCREKKYLLRPVIVQPGLTPTQFGIAYGDEIRLIVCLVCLNLLETQGWSSRWRKAEYQLYKFIRLDVRLEHHGETNTP